MSVETVGLIGITALLVLILMKIWVGFALALVGILGYAYIEGWSKALSMVSMEPYSQLASLTLIVLPLFVLMGEIISNTGLTSDLYEGACKLIGRVRGGLAMATMLACGAFAAVCGSSTATAITIGRIAYPQMRKYNYGSKLAAGSIAAGGTIGILIPPSMGLIFYGVITEQSIGKLFLAGIIPGITQVIFYIVTIFIICFFNRDIAPPLLKGESLKFRDTIVSLRMSGAVLIIFLVVIGGIYLGFFTPNEAAAIGAFASIIIGIVCRRFTWDNFRVSIVEATLTTTIVATMIIGAFIFVRFLAVSKLPFMLSDFIAAAGLSRIMFILMIIVFYLVLGCFFDLLSVIILTVPIIYPTVIACGFNPIWFGVIVVRLIEIGLCTPPIGMNVFVLSGSLDIPIGVVFRGVIPFLIADFFHLTLLIAVPELSLLLVK